MWIVSQILIMWIVSQIFLNTSGTDLDLVEGLIATN